MIDKADIAFVPAVPEDLSYFRDLRIKVMRPHVERQGLRWDQIWEDEFHRQLFEQGLATNSLYMIHDHGARVGFIGLRADADHVHLGPFCLEPERQNQGLGTCVLAIVFAEMDVQKRKVELNILKVNPAVHLYERFGFDKVGEDETLFYYERAPQPLTPSFDVVRAQGSFFSDPSRKYE